MNLSPCPLQEINTHTMNLNPHPLQEINTHTMNLNPHPLQEINTHTMNLSPHPLQENAIAIVDCLPVTNGCMVVCRKGKEWSTNVLQYALKHAHD